jgi:uncharacterized membrane protein YfcA
MPTAPDAPWLFPLLFMTGLAAGWVNAITGGGGLVVLPIFLAVGVPPHLALGTNMLQSSAGTLAAAYTFVHQRQVNLREAALGIVCTVAGAVGGVVAVQQLVPTVLKDLLPLVLAGIVIYTACAPRVGLMDTRPTMAPGVFYPLAGMALGFFDGCIGAGAGSLWAMAFVMGLGFNLAKATAYAKVMNVASNVAAFTLFLGYGSVWLAAGLVMALGQVIGGVLGAHLVMHKGAGFVRPLYLIVVIALLLKLLYERFSGMD